MAQISLEREVINMPNKNGTGPEGKGPKTGRGLGLCGDNSSERKKQGQRSGRGMGLRRAWVDAEKK